MSVSLLIPFLPLTEYNQGLISPNECIPNDSLYPQKKRTDIPLSNIWNRQIHVLWGMEEF